MKTSLLLLWALILSNDPAWGSRDLYLKVVGSVGEHVVTSREVEASSILDRGLFQQDQPIQATPYGSEGFKNMLNRVLIEWMVFEEAKVFDVASATEEEINQSINAFRSRLSANPPARQRWAVLGVGDKLLREMVVRKVRANKFIKYKSNSSYVQVSDEEARDYFNKNRLKFGTLEFEKFKPNIKAYLAKSNAEARIRDWFDILKKKHQVRNLVGEDVRPQSSN